MTGDETNLRTMTGGEIGKLSLDEGSRPLPHEELEKIIKKQGSTIDAIHRIVVRDPSDRYNVKSAIKNVLDIHQEHVSMIQMNTEMTESRKQIDRYVDTSKIRDTTDNHQADIDIQIEPVSDLKTETAADEIEKLINQLNRKSEEIDKEAIHRELVNEAEKMQPEELGTQTLRELVRASIISEDMQSQIHDILTSLDVCALTPSPNDDAGPNDWDEFRNQVDEFFTEIDTYVSEEDVEYREELFKIFLQTKATRLK